MPFAEQIAWRLKHPTPPLHAISSYGLIDLELLAYLTTQIKIGVEVKLFKKTWSYEIWKFAKAWDIGSLQKAKYQPGLESTYQDSCDPTEGVVTNYQPGAAAGSTCSGGGNLVCRYPDTSGPQGPLFDQPNELIDYCKGVMPSDVEDPAEPTAQGYADFVGDLAEFAEHAGQHVWETQQLCVGSDGETLLHWLQNAGSNATLCSYTGDRAGAPTSFPCNDTDQYLLEVWGCVDADAGAGLTVKNLLANHGLGSYFGTPAYASSSTSNPVLYLHKILIDPSAAPDWSNVDPAIRNAVSFLEQLQILNWLAQVEQCFAQNHGAETECDCTTATDCDTGAGQTCSGGRCTEANGYLAQCPFLEFGGAMIHPCCGDGVVSTHEQCDDGNNLSNDGCTWECRSEGPGACCLVNGCADLPHPGECDAANGVYFAGSDCQTLDYCGHPVCDATPEVCDGRDNDCDGRIDEDATGQDTDGDGVANLCDNCRAISNPGQEDRDGDGLGDACQVVDGRGPGGRLNPDLVHLEIADPDKPQQGTHGVSNPRPKGEQQP